MHLRLLQAAAATERFFGGRGLGYLTTHLGRIFGTDDYLIGRVESGLLKVAMNDAYWITPLLRTGLYEPEVGAVLRRTLRSDSAFVDCGANIGYWSVFAACLIGLPDRVLAIEANPRAANWLKENSRLNAGSFKVLEAAVWSTNGKTIEIVAEAARHAWSSADPKVASTLIRAGFASSPVETITIDKAVGDLLGQEPKVLVVKIDVEGSEGHALEGASRVMELDSLVIYEEHGRDGDAQTTNLLLKESDRHVYSLSRLREPRRIETIEQIHQFMTDRSIGYNFCCVRPGTEAQRRLLSN